MPDVMTLTGKKVEEVLNKNFHNLKILDYLFILRKGSTVETVLVEEFKEIVIVKCTAYMVKGVKMSFEFSRLLLSLNSIQRFGAFGYSSDRDLLLYSNTILGGDTLDEQEVLATVVEVAEQSDKYDNRFIAQYDGHTMAELVTQGETNTLIEDIEEMSMIQFTEEQKKTTRRFLNETFTKTDE